MGSGRQRGTQNPLGKISYGYAEHGSSNAKSTSSAELFAVLLHLHYKSTLSLHSRWRTFAGRLMVALEEGRVNLDRSEISKSTEKYIYGQKRSVK